MGRIIESGFCIVVHDFMAYVSPFETVRIETCVNAIPVYKVELPNGEIEEFNEFDLFIDKGKADTECRNLNERMKEKREFWLSEGLSALRRFERLGF